MMACISLCNFHQHQFILCHTVVDKKRFDAKIRVISVVT